MRTYLVTIPEIHERLIKVLANDSADALARVGMREGAEVHLKFDKSLDQTMWIVEEVLEDREDA
jgi:hypothetical protein